MEMPIGIVGAEEVGFGLWSKEPIVVTEADRSAMEDTREILGSASDRVCRRSQSQLEIDPVEGEAIELVRSRLPAGHVNGVRASVRLIGRR